MTQVSEEGDLHGGSACGDGKEMTDKGGIQEGMYIDWAPCPERSTLAWAIGPVVMVL